MPASTRRSGSEAGLLKTASKGRVRPSQVTNVPALSDTGATGNTTSATRVTSVSRTSSATTNGRVERGAGAGRVGGVVGVDAAHDHGTQRAVGERGDDRVGVATSGLGDLVDAPGGGHVDAGSGIGDRPAAGQQGRQAAGLDRATVTGTARHPGEPGAGSARPGRRRR